MGLTLKILSLLHRQYEPNSGLKLATGKLEILMFIDNDGRANKALIYLKDRCPTSGVWYFRKAKDVGSGRKNYVWEIVL